MLKRLIRSFMIAAAIAVCMSTAFAWDETGHKITAYIAWQRMTPDVRERVIKILLTAPEDSDIGALYMSNNSRSLESKRREFFMLMATWPDIIRDKSFE